MKLQGEKGLPPHVAKVPKGTHLAICARYIDEGTHDSGFKDKDDNAKMQRRLHLVFEVCLSSKVKAVQWQDKQSGETRVAPPTLWTRCNATMGTATKPSNLRDIFRALTGVEPDKDAEVDLKDMIGKACLIEVGHNVTDDGSVWERIENCVPVPEGMPVPKLVCEPFTYDIVNEAGNLVEPLSQMIPDRIAKSIKESPEYRGGAASKADDVDSTPF